MRTRQLTAVILMSLFMLINPLTGLSPEPPVREKPSPIDCSARYSEWRHSIYLETIAQVLSEKGDLGFEAALEIVHLAYEEGVRRDVDLYRILGFIIAESNGNSRAVSPVGARGLMQIMPRTGEFIALNLGDEWSGTDSLFDVPLNIFYGVWYYSYLLEVFEGDEHAAIAAYNWGPTNIADRIQKGSKLPQVYPGKVYAAERMLQESVYGRAALDIQSRAGEYVC